jgi:hypothetical protein
MIEQPADFAPGEISVDDKAGLVFDEFGPSGFFQTLTEGGGSAVLPDNRIVDRHAGLSIPNDSGFALICDAESSNVFGGQLGFRENVPRDLDLSIPDFARVMLDPAGLGEDLLKFLLSNTMDSTAAIKDNSPGTRSSLVQDKNEIGHGWKEIRRRTHHCNQIRETKIREFYDESITLPPVNSFVDPSQRGVELPAGCKALIDVLAKPGVDRLQMPSKAGVGSLRRVGSFMGHLSRNAFADQVLVIMYFAKSIFLVVAKNENAFKLRFLLRKSDTFLEDATSEIFGEAALATDRGMGMDEFKTITVRLPEFWDDATQMIVDLLIRAYGVTENHRLFSVASGYAE